MTKSAPPNSLRLEHLQAVTTSAYNNWTLNATGTCQYLTARRVPNLSYATATTLNNEAPAMGDTTASMASRWADQTGTTQDPKLVVEHTARQQSAPIAPTSLLARDNPIPRSVTDTSSRILRNLQRSRRWRPSATITASRFLPHSPSPPSTGTPAPPPWQRPPQGNSSPDIILCWIRPRLLHRTTGASHFPMMTAPLAYGLPLTATFFLAQPVTEGAIQDITFAYDANGNITHITDSRDTDAVERSHLHLR